MKAISKGISRRFWRRLDNYLLDLESFRDWQAMEDARALGVFFNALAASRECSADGDLIDRFEQVVGTGNASSYVEMDASDAASTSNRTGEPEAEFLHRYLADFQPLWWQWLFYPVRSVKLVRCKRFDVDPQASAWLAESVEADLRVLEFGSLTPTYTEANDLRRAIETRKLPPRQLSMACRSMALSRTRRGWIRRRHHPQFAPLCKLGRDACYGVGGLCTAATVLSLAIGVTNTAPMLIGLAAIAGSALVTGRLFQELGPRWVEADRLLDGLTSTSGDCVQRS